MKKEKTTIKGYYEPEQKKLTEEYSITNCSLCNKELTYAEETIRGLCATCTKEIDDDNKDST